MKHWCSQYWCSSWRPLHLVVVCRSLCTVSGSCYEMELGWAVFFGVTHVPVIAAGTLMVSDFMPTPRGCLWCASGVVVVVFVLPRTRSHVHAQFPLAGPFLSVVWVPKPSPIFTGFLHRGMHASAHRQRTLVPLQRVSGHVRKGRRWQRVGGARLCS